MERRVVVLNVGDFIPEEAYAELFNHAEVAFYGRASPEELRRAEVLVTFRLTREDLQMMPNLKVVQILSAGVDHLDWSSIPEDLIVCSNAGSNAIPVAEHALALLLAAAKRVTYYDARCRSGDFTRDRTTKILHGSEIAVLGLGPIGMRVAELAKALGMRVRGFARRPRGEPFIDEFFAYPDVRGALNGADLAVLALPLNKHTKGLIGYGELGAMKRDGVMVNVGRGGVVSKPDLIRFLRENPEFTYATDVFWSPEIAQDSDVAALPNVIATPWIAGAFGHPRVYVDMVRHAVSNVIGYLRGEGLRNVVDRSDYV